MHFQVNIFTLFIMLGLLFFIGYFIKGIQEQGLRNEEGLLITEFEYIVKGDKILRVNKTNSEITLCKLSMLKNNVTDESTLKLSCG